MQRRLEPQPHSQAGPTAHEDGLKWAYERRPRARWASRRLSGGMGRDLRHAWVSQRGKFQGCKAGGGVDDDDDGYSSRYGAGGTEESNGHKLHNNAIESRFGESLRPASRRRPSSRRSRADRQVVSTKP